jgi:hypothetical protein
MLILFLLPLSARAGLICPAPEHDAGEARTGAKLSHTFRLVNQGSQAVEVRKVKAGCGCTLATVSRQTIEPGGTAELRMEVSTVTQAVGPNAWRADVIHSGGELTVVMRARLQAEVRITPATLVLHANGPVSHPFTLIEHRAEPMKLRLVATQSGKVQATAGPPRRQGDTWAREVVVRVSGLMPEGRHEDALVIQAEGSAYPELRVPFVVIKKSRATVQASPASVDLVRGPQGEAPSRVVLLHVSGDDPVRVRSVRTGHPGVRCTWADGEGRAVLRASVEAGGGPISTVLEVELSEPAQVVKIPLTVK